MCGSSQDIGEMGRKYKVARRGQPCDIEEESDRPVEERKWLKKYNTNVVRGEILNCCDCLRML